MVYFALETTTFITYRTLYKCTTLLPQTTQGVALSALTPVESASAVYVSQTAVSPYLSVIFPNCIIVHLLLECLQLFPVNTI